VADVLKREKGPLAARVRMRGRVEAVEAAEKSTSGSCLDAREMEKRQWCRRGFGCHRGFALSFPFWW
jgi:hypothetical protein